VSAELASGIVRILGPKQDQGKSGTVLTTAGTGFLVTADGLIATCAHVVAGFAAGIGARVELVFQTTGEQHSATVVSWAEPEAQDVAILRLDRPPPLPAISLPLSGSSAADGDAFRTFGFPSASPIEGMAAKLEVVGRVTQAGFPVLQMRSTEVTPGFSGAPVLDTRTGSMVGMVTAIARPDQFGRLVQTAFITPTETLRDVCPDLALSDVCPYRSLDVFTEDDSPYFFGRTQVVAALLESLRRVPAYLAVLGPSGSGKSSLVRAGLIPTLAQGALPGSERWTPVLVAPGPDPAGALAIAAILAWQGSLTLRQWASSLSSTSASG